MSVSDNETTINLPLPFLQPLPLLYEDPYKTSQQSLFMPFNETQSELPQLPSFQSSIRTAPLEKRQMLNEFPETCVGFASLSKASFDDSIVSVKLPFPRETVFSAMNVWCSLASLLRTAASTDRSEIKYYEVPITGELKHYSNLERSAVMREVCERRLESLSSAYDASLMVDRLFDLSTESLAFVTKREDWLSLTESVLAANHWPWQSDLAKSAPCENERSCFIFTWPLDIVECKNNCDTGKLSDSEPKCRDDSGRIEPLCEEAEPNKAVSNSVLEDLVDCGSDGAAEDVAEGYDEWQTTLSMLLTVEDNPLHHSVKLPGLNRSLQRREIYSNRAVSDLTRSLSVPQKLEPQESLPTESIHPLKIQSISTNVPDVLMPDGYFSENPLLFADMFIVDKTEETLQKDVSVKELPPPSIAERKFEPPAVNNTFSAVSENGHHIQPTLQFPKLHDAVVNDACCQSETRQERQSLPKSETDSMVVDTVENVCESEHRQAEETADLDHPSTASSDQSSLASDCCRKRKTITLEVTDEMTVVFSSLHQAHAQILCGTSSRERYSWSEDLFDADSLYAALSSEQDDSDRHAYAVVTVLRQTSLCLLHFGITTAYLYLHQVNFSSPATPSFSAIYHRQAISIFPSIEADLGEAYALLEKHRNSVAEEKIVDHPSHSQLKSILDQRLKKCPTSKICIMADAGCCPVLQRIVNSYKSGNTSAGHSEKHCDCVVVAYTEIIQSLDSDSPVPLLAGFDLVVIASPPLNRINFETSLQQETGIGPGYSKAESAVIVEIETKTPTINLKAQSPPSCLPTAAGSRSSHQPTFTNGLHSDVDLVSGSGKARTRVSPDKSDSPVPIIVAESWSNQSALSESLDTLQSEGYVRIITRKRSAPLDAIFPLSTAVLTVRLEDTESGINSCYAALIDADKMYSRVVVLAEGSVSKCRHFSALLCSLRTQLEKRGTHLDIFPSKSSMDVAEWLVKQYLYDERVADFACLREEESSLESALNDLRCFSPFVSFLASTMLSHRCSQDRYGPTPISDRRMHEGPFDILMNDWKRVYVALSQRWNQTDGLRKQQFELCADELEVIAEQCFQNNIDDRCTDLFDNNISTVSSQPLSEHRLSRGGSFLASGYRSGDDQRRGAQVHPRKRHRPREDAWIKSPSKRPKRNHPLRRTSRIATWCWQRDEQHGRMQAVEPELHGNCSMAASDDTASIQLSTDLDASSDSFLNEVESDSLVCTYGPETDYQSRVQRIEHAAETSKKQQNCRTSDDTSIWLGASLNRRLKINALNERPRLRKLQSVDCCFSSQSADSERCGSKKWRHRARWLR